MAGKFGIDVSYCQPNINWKKIKETGKVKFAILRCGYGSDYSYQDDEEFLRNVQECEKYEIPYGLYLYSYAKNNNMVLSEAAHAKRLIKKCGKMFKLGLWYDMEEAWQYQLGGLCLGFLNSFVWEFKDEKFKTGVYSNLSWLYGPLRGISDKIPVWVAQWNSECQYKGNVVGWQYGTTTVDGIKGEVDADIWYDDFETTTKTEKTETKTETKKTGTYTASDLIKIARNEVGYKEKNTNSNLEGKTENAGHNNWTKYARDLYAAGYYNGNKNGYHWCDVFVDWCHFKAAGSKALAEAAEYQTGELGAGCGYSMGYYKAAGAFDRNPKLGDQVFFSWSKNPNDIDHTGIVFEIDEKNFQIRSVEGNSNDEVSERTYSMSDGCIIGYGHPNFAAEKKTTPTTKKKTVTTLAKEVLNGVWGNGDERKTKLTQAGYDYDKVQAKVNELLKPKSYKVKVTAVDGLNCRKGAGLGYGIVTAYVYGTELTITETDANKEWGKTDKGWIYLKYTKAV